MEDCCAVPLKGTDHDQSVCPTCGRKGKPVREETIRALTLPEHPDYESISDGFFCTTPTDSTVYFIRGKNIVISKQDVAVRVGIKETEEPIYVCYCFRHTKADIESDYVAHGRSTIEGDIRDKVGDKLCSCEVKNPSGRCCLGDVRKTYLRSQRTRVAVGNQGEKTHER